MMYFLSGMMFHLLALLGCFVAMMWRLSKNMFTCFALLGCMVFNWFAILRCLVAMLWLLWPLRTHFHTGACVWIYACQCAKVGTCMQMCTCHVCNLFGPITASMPLSLPSSVQWSWGQRVMGSQGHKVQAGKCMQCFVVGLKTRVL